MELRRVSQVIRFNKLLTGLMLHRKKALLRPVQTRLRQPGILPEPVERTFQAGEALAGQFPRRGHLLVNASNRVGPLMALSNEPLQPLHPLAETFRP